jgi:hypothetical protein
MRRRVSIALLGLALAATTAMAADLRITAMSPEHANPDITGYTLIEFTFSDGKTLNYDFPPAKPDDGADDVTARARVRSWHVGDIVEFSVSEDCFMGVVITDKSKDTPQAVCFN